MSFFYTTAQERIAKALLSLETADLRWLLVLPTTTAINAASTATFLTDFATLAEVVDGAYSRQAMGSRTVTKVAAQNYTKVTTGLPLIFGAMAPGITVQAALLYEHISDVDDSLNRPVFLQDEGGLPKQTDGQSFLLQEPPTGWLQLVSGVPVT